MEGKNPNCKYGRYDCMPCTNCDAYIPPMTNADRIRAMTDEELADVLIFWNDDWGRWETDAGNICEEHSQVEAYKKALKAELDWLQKPAEEG